MKKLFSLAALLLFCGFISAQPKLELSKTYLSAGFFDKDSALQLQTMVYNKGIFPLRIWSATSSRTQDELHYPRKDIAPGDSSLITIHLKPPFRLRFNADVHLQTNTGKKYDFHYSGLSNDSSGPKIRFLNDVVDFDTVYEHQQVVKVTYTFQNTGNEPLVLKAVKTSCGCLVASWSKEPILPGAYGEIKAILSVKGRVGNNHKTITCLSNAIDTPTKVLYIKGKVLSNPAQLELGSFKPIAESDQVRYRYKTKAKEDTLLFDFGNLATGQPKMGIFSFNSGEYPLGSNLSFRDLSNPFFIGELRTTKDTAHAAYKNSFYRHDTIWFQNYGYKSYKIPSNSDQQFFRFTLMNTSGNTGEFEYVFNLRSNSPKPIIIKVIGNCVDDGQAKKVILRKGSHEINVIYQKDGEVMKVEYHSYESTKVLLLK